MSAAASHCLPVYQKPNVVTWTDGRISVLSAFCRRLEAIHSLVRSPTLRLRLVISTSYSRPTLIPRPRTRRLTTPANNSCLVLAILPRRDQSLIPHTFLSIFSVQSAPSLCKPATMTRRRTGRGDGQRDSSPRQRVRQSAVESCWSRVQ